MGVRQGNRLPGAARYTAYPIFYRSCCNGGMRLFMGMAVFVCLLPAQEIRCPQTIETKLQVLAKEAPGWKAVARDSRHELANVTVYDGPIEENASLVPDGTRKVGKKVEEFWKLDAKSRRGYWLQCQYAATSLTLVRPASKGAASCVVTANPAMTLEGRAVIEAAVCK